MLYVVCLEVQEDILFMYRTNQHIFHINFCRHVTSAAGKTSSSYQGNGNPLVWSLEFTVLAVAIWAFYPEALSDTHFMFYLTLNGP